MATSGKSKNREYVRPIPATWWLKRPAYTRFMVREIGSGFLAGYAVFLLLLMSRAGDADAFGAMLESLKSPLSIVLHLVVLFFALFHSITFFNLTPKVLVFRRGEEKVPDGTIQGAHYALWAVVSLVLFTLVFVTAR